MEFISTRGNTTCSLDKAIVQGLADDDGLFIPKVLPAFDWQNIANEKNYSSFAYQMLMPFFADSILLNQLEALCQRAFNFSIPLTKMEDTTFLMELFHGPTLSFKDVGARFLAECLAVLAGEKKYTVMVATSGDTGSAVASSLYQKKGLQVVVLYPYKKIAKIQEKQITCYGDNVLALAVEGVFDDCQALVKTFFKDAWCQANLNLTTANSINIARLLPQMVYYAYWSCQFAKSHQQRLSFIVPSGNLGNVTACYYAKACGFPIEKIAIATNANRVLSDYIKKGVYTPQKTIETLANAMDVGSPSNFERLNQLFPTVMALQQNAHVLSVSDEQIIKTIKQYEKGKGIVICPHTAVGCFMRDALPKTIPYAIAATAHPAKFENSIAPLIGKEIVLPDSLQNLLDKKTKSVVIKPTLQALKKVMIDYFNM